MKLLRGEGLLPEEGDAQRGRLLAGFRWILVDEYQDVGPDQYELISALAGRTREARTVSSTSSRSATTTRTSTPSTAARVAFIRRFEEDYGPKPSYLLGNYRSAGHIVAAANAVIEPARGRMKTGYPIHIDKARAKAPPGGDWEKLDPVARGRVQVLPAGSDPVSQAQAVMAEFRRLAALTPDWDWSRCAAIAREWKPVWVFCEAQDIPVQMGNEEIPSFWRLRETRGFVDWLRAREPRVVDGAAVAGWMEECPPGPWYDLLRQAVEEHTLETGGGDVPVDHMVEWLAEWGREIRRRQLGPLLLDRPPRQGA